MFDRFGEFDSHEEINELAENLFNEGDLESISVLAKENGIDADMVEAYVSGDTDQLCDVLDAALGKLEVEEKDLKPQELMSDWLDYLKSQCMENDELARAVRKKNKSLKGCIGALLVWSFGHQQPIDKEILKAAKVNASRVTFGIPGMARAKQIIREYYLGK